MRRQRPQPKTSKLLGNYWELTHPLRLQVPLFAASSPDWYGVDVPRGLELEQPETIGARAVGLMLRMSSSAASLACTCVPQFAATNIESAGVRDGPVTTQGAFNAAGMNP
jgi:hypothetical protein